MEVRTSRARTATHPRRPSAARATIALAAGLLVACGPAEADDPDSVVARDATDVVAHEGDVELLTAALVGSSGGAVSLASEPLVGSVQLADIGDGARAIFSPSGCLTTAHTPATRTVTYTFKDCVGPFGLRKLSGTVRVVYTKTPAGLTLDAGSDGLSVGRAQVRFTARAEIVAPSAASAERTTTWHADITGSSARDRAMSRSVDRTLTFATGESCIEASGASTGTVGGAALEVVVEKVRRCRGACPEAGGRIRATGAGRPPLDLAFDGTTEAKLTVDGKPRTITLACAK